MNLIKKFLLFSSSADLEVLQRCKEKGNNEYGKHITVGVAVLLTGVFAAMAGGYAMYRVFVGDSYAIFYAILFGLLWGIMIYNFDRFIVQGIDKTESWWRQGLTALPRIGLAIIISLVIAKPLEVKLFSDRLAVEINNNRIELDSVTRVQTNENLGVNSSSERVRRTEGLISDTKRKLGDLPDTEAYRAAVATEKRAKVTNENYRSKNLRKWREARNRIETIENDPTLYSITDGNRRYYVGAQEELNKLRPVKSSIGEQLYSYRKAYERAQNERERLEAEYKTQQETNLVNLETSLGSQQTELDSIVTAAEGEIAVNTMINKRSYNENFITQLEALGRLTEKDETFYAINLFLILLFLAVETAPIFVKLFLNEGAYDIELGMRKRKFKFQSDMEFDNFKRDEKRAAEMEVIANEKIIGKLADAQVELVEASIDEWKKEELSKMGEEE